MFALRSEEAVCDESMAKPAWIDRSHGTGTCPAVRRAGAAPELM
jgi:hypothetical protein